MATTYNTTSGDYTLTVNGGTGTFTINAANTIFNGNITQTGNLTTVDDFIVVAANNTGTITDMGLLAQTGASAFAGLRFNTTANAWQISANVAGNGAPVTAYANILTTASVAAAAGANTQIQFNNSGAFGANAALTYNFFTNTLSLQGYQVLGNVASPPSTPSNAVALYNSTVGGGGTGVYVLSSSVDDELVSKAKAIIYGIIF
jgi:hypothetical protein